jgi:hypothetical protein
MYCTCACAVAFALNAETTIMTATGVLFTNQIIEKGTVTGIISNLLILANSGPVPILYFVLEFAMIFVSTRPVE